MRETYQDGHSNHLPDLMQQKCLANDSNTRPFNVVLHKGGAGLHRYDVPVTRSGGFIRNARGVYIKKT